MSYASNVSPTDMNLQQVKIEPLVHIDHFKKSVLPVLQTARNQGPQFFWK